jgi:hypothetical protein
MKLEKTSPSVIATLRSYVGLITLISAAVGKK